MTAEDPVILVGTPRSGSTLLSRLLNESPELFVVNDFYFLQTIDQLGAFDQKLSPDLGARLAEELAERIRARIEEPGSDSIEDGLNLTAEQDRKLDTLARSALSDGDRTWSGLLQAVMPKVGRWLGKSRWGYNTPQDHMHLDRIFAAFPKARVVFLMRDPRDMLKSYQNVTENDYHHPHRYHPLLQSLAWRSAVRRYFLERQNGRAVMLVRYEDVVADVNATLAEIAAFAEISMPPLDLDDFGNNSSFASKSEKQQGLHHSETWICEKICGSEMKELGYALSDSRIELGDVAYLSKLTGRAFWFYLSRFVGSADIRRRILHMMKNSLVLNRKTF